MPLSRAMRAQIGTLIVATSAIQLGYLVAGADRAFRPDCGWLSAQQLFRRLYAGCAALLTSHRARRAYSCLCCLCRPRRSRDVHHATFGRTTVLDGTSWCHRIWLRRALCRHRELAEC
jgi:hypothetical protein